ncbi:putative serine/threonine-protein kinase SIK2 [Apostichopus japonicus]|uniref:Putative serine/threonine-protein kinase SIK2 n=1 Tax=Stichopus japonicus TaxID=307972 RepID=A0A2G8JY26_STIJA|nr:putative serine/threonine-protein kinase SIK2 [Apostichopus japonicus]
MLMDGGQPSPRFKPRPGRYLNRWGEFNEQALRLMQSLGIDQQKTMEALRRDSYDHYTAIYYLLVERLKLHRCSFPVEGRVDLRNRRPSSVAEHAMMRTSVGVSPPMVRAQTGVRAPMQSPHQHQQFVNNAQHSTGFYPIQSTQQPNHQPIISESAQVALQRKMKEPMAPPHTQCIFNESDIVPSVPSVKGTLLDPLPIVSSRKVRSMSPKHMVVTSIDEGVEADMPDSEQENEKGSFMEQYLGQRSTGGGDPYEISPSTQPCLSDFGIEPQELSGSFDSNEEMEISQSFSQCQGLSDVLSTPPCNSPDMNSMQESMPAALQWANSQSPVSFREGRRASDGLLLQSAMGTTVHTPKNIGHGQGLNDAATLLQQAQQTDMLHSCSVAASQAQQHQQHHQQHQQTQIQAAGHVASLPATSSDHTTTSTPNAAHEADDTQRTHLPPHSGSLSTRSSLEDVSNEFALQVAPNARTLQQRLLQQKLMQKRQQFQKSSQLSQQFQRMQLERQPSFEGRPPAPNRNDSYRQAQQHQILPQCSFSEESCQNPSMIQQQGPPRRWSMTRACKISSHSMP